MGHTSVNGPGYSVDVTTDYIETLVIGCIVSDFQLETLFFILLMSNSILQAVVILIIICLLICCVCRGGCLGKKTSKNIIIDGENGSRENQNEATFGLVFLNVIINLSIFTSIDFSCLKYELTLLVVFMEVNIDNFLIILQK